MKRADLGLYKPDRIIHDSEIPVRSFWRRLFRLGPAWEDVLAEHNARMKEIRSYWAEQNHKLREGQDAAQRAFDASPWSRDLTYGGEP
jgi:hypothetical protein